jgi:hypothetical protein
MAQNERPSIQQSVSLGRSPPVIGNDLSKTKSDEWSDVMDPNERRKIQNKLAQRRFRKSIFIHVTCSIDFIQETKLKSRKKTPSGKWKINAGRGVRTPPRNQMRWKAVTLFQVCHGGVYR